MTHALTNIIDFSNAPTPPRWFEFVFEPEKLEKHLDLAPIEIITSFFKNMPESESTTSPNVTQNSSNGTIVTNGNTDNVEANELCDVIIPPGSYEAKYRSRKTYALQTLAIKVASHLKWDLDTLCDGLTIPIQCRLLQALKKACEHEKCPPDVRMFANMIYCRWFLRSAIAYKLYNLQPQSSSTTIIYLSQLQQQQQTADNLALVSMGDLFSESRLRDCVEELHSHILNLRSSKDNCVKKVKTTNNAFKKTKLSRPKLNCFDSRDEDLNNWDECDPIDPSEFMEEACYDLGRSLFFEENYLQAKEMFEMITSTKGKFPLLDSFINSTSAILETDDKPADDSEAEPMDEQSPEEITNQPPSERIAYCDKLSFEMNRRRKQTEKYLFDCMSQYNDTQARKMMAQASDESNDEVEEDTDLRMMLQGINHQRLPENSAWYLQVPVDQQQQQLLEIGKGDLFMSRGNFKQAMSCFVGSLMLATDYFRLFSKNYIDEESLITRMIQCSISLSCFTQAVALCQMTKNLNYTIAFKQLNERVCNDCCDDIYECIWNVTLLEYIINLHARRGEVERRTKVIQLIGQLELNENNSEEILREAEHVRRGRFFRIMSNKYL